MSNHMTLIPGGRFIMGTSPEQRRRLADTHGVNPDLFQIQPCREVYLPPFLIDRFPVTHREYRVFIEATGHCPPLPWLDRGYPLWLDDCPATGMDFADACAFAIWAGKRLPSEAEWEMAARGTDGRLWPWGNHWEPSACKMDNAGDRPLPAHPAPIGTHPRDCSVYGVMDMAGNVCEWVDGFPRTDFAMTKGGSFVNSQAFNFICANRNAQPVKNGHLGYIGFRCAKDVDEATAEDRSTAQPVDGREAPRVSASSPDEPIDVIAPMACPSPVPSTYRSRPIQLKPIRHADPTWKAYGPNVVNYAPPDRSVPMIGRVASCCVGLHIPYLPGDQFKIFFENFWTWTGQWETDGNTAVFSSDSTQADFQLTSHHHEIEASIHVRGELDCVDIDYELKNVGSMERPTHEMCFQAHGAPNFRDHDGVRTFVATDQGFKPMVQARHNIDERQWLQDYAPLDKEPAKTAHGPVITGPLLATVSRDGQWVISPTSLSGHPVRLFYNREYSCLHCNPESRLKPGEQCRLRQRVYFLQGTLSDLAERWESDQSASE